MESSPEELFVHVGDTVRFSKTVSEADVYMFAGISGDFAPYHVNEQFMRGTTFGRRIAHGALIVGYMSACSSKLVELVRERGGSRTPVSLGYDRIRFVQPVYLGDTVCCTYRVAGIEPNRFRARAHIHVTNQHDEIVADASHILKWVGK